LESVERFGVLQLIGLIESSNGFQVGFGRRIKAARASGFIAIPAYLYLAGWSPREVLMLIENQQRKTNLEEDLEAIPALRRFCCKH